MVKASPNFPEIEKEILKYWKENNTFKTSIKNRKDSNSDEFVFYDGPPFANGLPHYGHLLTGYVKDVIPRYKTMQGYLVERRFGWDTHGLPAEIEVENELGIENKSQIDEMGLEKFNAACKKSVLKYTNEWQEYVARQARWVDFENDYKTLEISYMESVIWAFKELYKKGLIYQDYKVLPYCWHDQTPLSNHELRMDDDVYKDRQDNTVTVGVRLVGSDEYAIIWTTTPWTLPSNFAISVGADIDYVTINVKDGEFAGKKIILAKAALSRYKKEFGEINKSFDIIKEFKGKELDHKKYYPVFNFFADMEEEEDYTSFGKKENRFQFTVSDHVTTEDGTGLVHIAPYGEDDMLVLNRYEVKIETPVDNEALFTEDVSDYQGQFVFDANKQIIRDLRNSTGPLEKVSENERPILIREQSAVHSYPHCWRCRKPLIYKPISSWFVKVTAVKEEMLKQNENINWIPENVKHGQFGKWLENARDWSISRNRYWGAPIPVWISDDPKYKRVEVYGSIKELEEAFGVEIKDLHRPFIDTLVRPNPDDPTGKSMMRRVPEVFDCWFESGSMPYAQVHYPFENKDWFDTHYPGDFVVEYIGQTRGWFYTMHVLATALFGKNPFSNVMCHGIVLGSDGLKMSKSLKNYPDVNEVFNKFGSDPMRWFLMSSSILTGGNLIVTKEGIKDASRKVLLPLWSSLYFYDLYTKSANNGAGYAGRLLKKNEIDSLENIDKYILAKLREFIIECEKDLDDFLISSACEKAEEFIDVLTNWYIRNTRERFWNEDKTAFNTLFTVLQIFISAISPLLPLTCEKIYQELNTAASNNISNNNISSIHLLDWPKLAHAIDKKIAGVKETTNEKISDILPKNDELVSIMDAVREINSTVLGARKKNNIRVRQPLSNLQIFTRKNKEIKEYLTLLKRELNIKEISVYSVEEGENLGWKLDKNLTVNPREVGPRLGKTVQIILKNAKQGNWSFVDNKVIVHSDDKDYELLENEYSLSKKVSFESNEDNNENRSINILSDGFIALNLKLSKQLIQEGKTRDVIREIQNERKNIGLDVADRISLSISDVKENIDAYSNFKDLIASETLSKEISFNESGELKISIKKF